MVDFGKRIYEDVKKNLVGPIGPATSVPGPCHRPGHDRTSRGIPRAASKISVHAVAQRGHGRTTATSVHRVSLDLDSLVLRPIRKSDAERIHQWASNAEACRYQVWGPNSEAETRAFVDQAVAAWQRQPQRRWVWAVVDADGLTDGMGEVKQHTPGRAEIAYAVHVDHWGKGVGTAIARLLTHWVFNELPTVERVEATCDPRNVGSEKILRRIGMTYEGTLRHTMLIRDGWRDSKIFSILRDEWTGR